MTLDEGWQFNRTAGADLAERLRSAQPEVIVAPVTLGIPIMLYTAEALQIDSVPIYKTPKFHFGDALQVQVTSITTPGQAQPLYLDRRLVSRVAGKRVAVVDDVVNTAGTLRGVLELVRMAGGEVVRIGVLLTEGHDWRARARRRRAAGGGAWAYPDVSGWHRRRLGADPRDRTAERRNGGRSPES